MRILVTGAGGMIGGEVAGLLAERGHRVAALVHRQSVIRRADGRAVAGQIEPTPGDVRAERFGLPAGTEQGLDAIVHCAAVTAFDAPAEQYQAVNIGGARHALALGAAAGCPVVHVSTAYVCGVRNGAIGEDELAPGAPANGYEASKAEAERLARGAIAAGQAVVVARPSIVVGALADGAIRSFDNVYMLFRLFAEGRLSTMPATPDASLDFVPVDLVARAIADMAETPSRFAGRAFHLASGDPITPEDLRLVATEHAAFAVPRFVSPETFDPAALPPLERRLHQRLAALYVTYLSRNPRFDRRNAAAFAGFEAPCGGRTLLRRISAYAARAGFLPGGGVARAAPAAAALA